jgi:hypothetical protein
MRAFPISWLSSVGASLLASAVLFGAAGLGCDCTTPIYKSERFVSGDITWSGAARYASWGPDTWVGVGQTDTDDTDIEWFNDASDPPAVPGDLRIFPLFGAQSTNDPSDPFQTQLTFILMIHNVSASGPAEIDLDDTRATLTVGFAGDTTESLVGGGVPHHGIAGHVSLTQFSTGSCPAGPFSCDLTVRGTFSFTATGANGEQVAVTSGTLAGTTEIYEGTQMCAPVDS